MGNAPSFIPLVDLLSRDSDIRLEVFCRLVVKFATGRRRYASHK